MQDNRLNKGKSGSTLDRGQIDPELLKDSS